MLDEYGSSVANEKFGYTLEYVYICRPKIGKSTVPQSTFMFRSYGETLEEVVRKYISFNPFLKRKKMENYFTDGNNWPFKLEFCTPYDYKFRSEWFLPKVIK